MNSTSMGMETSPLTRANCGRVAQAIHGQIGNHALGGRGATAFKRPGAARLRETLGGLGIFQRVLISNLAAGGAAAVALVAAAIATAAAVRFLRAAVGVGQHGHDVGHRDLLVVQLLLLQARIVDVLHLNTDAFADSVHGVARDLTGAGVGIRVLIAVKRHTRIPPVFYARTPYGAHTASYAAAKNGCEPARRRFPFMDENRKIEFSLNGRDAVLICPDQPAPGMPWVWRAEFLGCV